LSLTSIDYLQSILRSRIFVQIFGPHLTISVDMARIVKRWHGCCTYTYGPGSNDLATDRIYDVRKMVDVKTLFHRHSWSLARIAHKFLPIPDIVNNYFVCQSTMCSVACCCPSSSNDARPQSCIYFSVNPCYSSRSLTDLSAADGYLKLKLALILQ